jgi:fructose-1,6-bisphosphatase
VARYSDLSVDLGRAETHDVCVTPWKQSMTCIQGTFASDLKATERKMIERYGKIWKDIENTQKILKDLGLQENGHTMLRNLAPALTMPGIS